MEEFLIYPIIGCFVGLIGGLLGVGGGVIIVPALAWLFESKGFSAEAIMHLAVGTSLATIIVTSIASVRAHHRHGAVRWTVFGRFSPGFAIGALLGAMLADALPTESLRTFFGSFIVLVGAQLLFGANPAPHRNLPGFLGLASVGTVIGTISAVVGIGGGNMTVPFLVWCNVPIRNAVATAAAAGIPIALFGAASFVITGLNETGLPAWTTGYVYWPAFVGIALMSALFAPLGARLAHTVPTMILRRGFGVFLCAVGVKMLLG